MNFDFESTAGVSQSSTRKPLEGNMIHDVIFDGCEARDFTGTQDSTKQFHVLEIKFHNDNGYFTHTIWEPREEDLKDREGAFGLQPSNFKVMMYTLKHLIDAVNPELGKKIDNKEVKLTVESWEALRKFMVDNTASGVGTTTKIKLIKNNKGEAMFPYFLNYNKENKLYMSTNFIGNGVFFTNKELDKIKKAESAKPTPASDLADGFAIPSSVPANDDFNMAI
jgi:hypothetical protein